MAGKCLLHVPSRILDPAPQHRSMDAQIAPGLRHRYTALGDKLHRLKLELSLNFRLSMTHLPVP